MSLKPGFPPCILLMEADGEGLSEEPCGCAICRWTSGLGLIKGKRYLPPAPFPAFALEPEVQVGPASAESGFPLQADLHTSAERSSRGFRLGSRSNPARHERCRKYPGPILSGSPFGAQWPQSYRLCLSCSNSCAILRAAITAIRSVPMMRPPSRISRVFSSRYLAARSSSCCSS